MLHRAFYEARTSVVELATRVKPIYAMSNIANVTWTMIIASDKKSVVCTGSSVVMLDQSHDLSMCREGVTGCSVSAVKGTSDQASIRPQVTHDSSAVIEDPKSALIRLISHEIRSPLSVISTSIAIMNSQKLTLGDEFRDLIDGMDMACRSKIGFLDNLMVYEKLESSTLSLHTSAFDLMELTRGVVNQLMPEAREHVVDLELIVDDCIESVIVDADQEKIEQVYRNLISDALKHSSSRWKVRIDLSTDGSDRTIRVEIKDWGRWVFKGGTTTAVQQPFSFDPNALQAHPGTGLGYYVSRGIIDMHSGSIKISFDKENAVLCVSIDLQISSLRCSKDKEECNFDLARVTTTKGLGVKDLRILVVDDVLTCRNFHRKCYHPSAQRYMRHQTVAKLLT